MEKTTRQMKREILCPKCSLGYDLHPLDYQGGFHMRRVAIVAQRPSEHGLTIKTDGHSVFTPMATLVCDHCAAPIHDGENAVAVTTWNGNREGEPGEWEKEYRK